MRQLLAGLLTAVMRTWKDNGSSTMIKYWVNRSSTTRGCSRTTTTASFSAEMTSRFWTSHASKPWAEWCHCASWKVRLITNHIILLLIYSLETLSQLICSLVVRDSNCRVDEVGIMHCYDIESTGVQIYSEVIEKCANEGGHFATISSEDELNFVAAVADQGMNVQGFKHRYKILIICLPWWACTWNSYPHRGVRNKTICVCFSAFVSHFAIDLIRQGDTFQFSRHEYDAPYIQWEVGHPVDFRDCVRVANTPTRFGMQTLACDNLRNGACETESKCTCTYRYVSLQCTIMIMYTYI